MPQYALMSNLGLVGTQVPLLLEPPFGAPGIIATFLMRQFFLSLPRELEDAGRVDGLSPGGVFVRVRDVGACLVVDGGDSMCSSCPPGTTGGQGRP